MVASAVVFVLAVLGGSLAWAAVSSPRHPDPVDPEAEERWLVGWLLRHPRIGHVAHAVDRRVAGGLLLAMSLVVVLLVAVVVGVVLSLVRGERGLARLDASAAEWGAEVATDESTRILTAITHLGGTEYLLAVAAVVAIVDVVRRRNPNVPLFLAAVLGGVSLINNALKLVVDRDRPDVEQLVGSAGSSYPSGHAAAAAAGWFAIALVVGRRSPRRFRAVLATVAVLISVAVAASRTLLGVHWVTDVVAGTVVGWGWFVVCALAFGGRLQRLGEPAERLDDATRAADERIAHGGRQTEQASGTRLGSSRNG